MESRSFSEITSETDEAASFRIENFVEFSVFIEKSSSILGELKDNNKLMDTVVIRKSVESLETELQRAKALMGRVSHSRQPLKKQIEEEMTHDLGRSLGLVLFAKKTEQTEETGETEQTEETEIEEEIVEEEITLDIDDVVLQVKYGNDDEFKSALSVLNVLIRDNTVTSEWVSEEGVIPILFNRLGSSKPDNRITIIQILRSLASQNDENKEKMAETGGLTTLVKSLARDVEEQREAVGLLLSLSEVSAARRRIGRIQGCIIVLVAILNGDEPVASDDAGKLLNALSSNTQNALHMAEAGYFKPLVHYLKEGSDMSKILMATALSRMELTDQCKASLGSDGAIKPLVKMFQGGKLEAKLSSLSALQNLSSLKENIQHLITTGIVSSLLQLLFSVTSVLMTLREPASAILRKNSRFTVPSDKKLQRNSVEQGVIPLLVKLLSNGSTVAKTRAAVALSQLSQNTMSLQKSKTSRWLCVSRSTDAFCEVHDSHCTVKGTFCLVKAGAISPMIQILERNERGSDEAVLGVLATLLQDEIWENGSNYIVKMSAVQTIIKIIEQGTVKAQEKALWILERIFRVEAHREMFGESAQVVLIDMAQTGDPKLKSMTAKILAQLELLQPQSSYF
ncbi:hypothetical protein Acr_15g0012300 [Actinidia rufa]|uniref:Cyclic nucleotide-binding domain-containing protein n=1 Tax=Actinidia rufa TaxID=165716 RepID=A0A7J0FVA5_9ERIC|nr:hypothetical protein Acr_15g0012300 [Actinidia rufa]